MVDVAGKVRRPGHRRAPLRARGGRRASGRPAAPGPAVDLASLNLAQRADRRGADRGRRTGRPAAGAVAAAGLGGSGARSTLVNLNTADETALESLPEVGPVTAQAIIAWRTEHGGFTAVDQLLDVDGIGDATLAKLTPYVTI